MQVRDMGELIKRYTLFASAVAAARGALLKSEVVQTLHTTVFTVLMEEAGKLVRANEDATKLTDIAPDMDLALAQKNAEKRLLLLEKGPMDDWQQVSSGSDLHNDWRRGEAERLNHAH